MVGSMGKWAGAAGAGMLATALCGPAGAVEVTAIPVSGSDVVAVFVSGPIEQGDGDKFARAVADVPKAVVILDGPGGSTFESLQMGRLVREKRYATLVQSRKDCFSGCALVWLAGSTRAMEKDANIGVHATYVNTPTQKVETGLGNAMVGSYLARMGLSDPAIAYASQAGPDDLQFITPENAGKLGIDVKVVEGDATRTVVPAAATAPTAVSSGDASRALVTGATRTTMGWLAAASSSEGPAGTAFSRLYGSQALIDGKAVDHASAVGLETRRVGRDKGRRYTLRDNRLVADCRVATGICTTTGVMDWRRAGRRTGGSYNFEFAMRVDGDGAGTILGRAIQPTQARPGGDALSASPPR